MPTTLQRTRVTHTPEIEHALDVGRRRWPNQPDSTVLANAVVEWSRGAEQELSALERLVLQGKATPPKNRVPGRPRRIVKTDTDVFAALAAERARR